MKEFLRKHTFIIITTAIGAAGGFLYWKFVGCVSGTCPIKSVWYMSTLWGLAVGYLAGSIIKDIIAYFKKSKALKSDINSDQQGENL
jgi:hypothetical protein